MANARATLWFHGDDPFGPITRSARAMGKDERVAASAPFAESDGRILARLGRLAAGLGVPVLLSLTNERLVRAFGHGQEKKALSDGASRRRLYPAATPAFGTESRLFAPVESADEYRLNTDLWKQALITPPFAVAQRNAHRVTIYSAEPADELTTYRPKGGPGDLICIDLGAIERGADPEGAMKRLGERLADIKLATPTAERPGGIDDWLREILVEGSRAPRFCPDNADGYDVGSHGYPLDLLHALLPESVATRSLTPHGIEILEANFDISKLAPGVARGVLFRATARAAGPDDVCPLARARASFLNAAVLLEQVEIDEAALPLLRAADAAPKTAAVADHLAKVAELTGAPIDVDAVTAAAPTDASDATAFVAALREQALLGLAALEKAAATEKDTCAA